MNIHVLLVGSAEFRHAESRILHERGGVCIQVNSVTPHPFKSLGYTILHSFTLIYTHLHSFTLIYTHLYVCNHFYSS